MQNDPLTSIVTITDQRFAIAVYVLVASLRYHGVKSKVTILGRGLTAKDSALFEQFKNVHVIESKLSSRRNPATLKGEAILAAMDNGAECVTLLDGDGLVTGNISKFLCPMAPGLYSRAKSKEEIAHLYRTKYEDSDMVGEIPLKVLNIWRKDIGIEKAPVVKDRIVASGNLTIHRPFLPFVREWQEQMFRVLPDIDKGSAHDYSSFAYQQLDESVLNSLLLFSSKAPPVYPYLLNQDPNAAVIHLGPAPKYWRMWSRDKLRYYGAVLEILAWAKKEGYQLPQLTWCLKRRNKISVYLLAYAHFAYRTFLSGLKRVLGSKS